MNSNFFSNLIWKFSERILAQGISFIVQIILARLLIPEQFGLVALVMIFINIANAIVVAGFNTALIQKKDADELDFSSVFWLSLAVAIILCFIIWFGVVPLSKFYNNDLIIPVFRVLSFRLIISAFNTVQHAYVARHLQFKKYFWSTLFGTLVSAIVGIYLAIKGYGVWALVFQYLTNTTIDTIVLLITVEWKPKLMFSFDRIRELFSFGSRILADSIFGTIQANLRNFIIGRTYTPADLGYYTKAQSIPALFINNITMSISSVLLPIMSNNNDKDDVLLSYLRRSSKLSAYIIFPILVGITCISNELVEVVLTTKWLPMVPYLQIFCIMNMNSVLMSPRNEALKAIGRSDIFFREHSFYRIFDIIILFIFVTKAPIVLLYTNYATSLLLLVMIMYNAQKYNHYYFLSQIMDISKTIVLCIIMCFITCLISVLQIDIKVVLLLKILVAVMTYMFFSILLNSEEYVIVKELIKRYVKIIKNKI